MNETQREIFKLIEIYLTERPGFRFGQALLNLSVNEFALPKVYIKMKMLYRGDEFRVCRDIFHDSDEEILKRMRQTGIIKDENNFEGYSRPYEISSGGLPEETAEPFLKDYI